MNNLLHKLGITQSDVFETIKREDFDSDEQFLDAATKYELERSTPEYLETRRRLARQYETISVDAVRAQQAEDFKRYRSAVSLDFLDRKEVDAEARRLAEADLAAGKIGRDSLGAAIAEHGRTLEEQRLDQKAANQHMNSLIRGR